MLKKSEWRKRQLPTTNPSSKKLCNGISRLVNKFKIEKPSCFAASGFSKLRQVNEYLQFILFAVDKIKGRNFLIDLSFSNLIKIRNRFCRI